MTYGDLVICNESSIDQARTGFSGKGEEGIIIGFARFSSYHPPEVSIRFEDGKTAWFWESSVQIVEIS